MLLESILSVSLTYKLIAVVVILLVALMIWSIHRPSGMPPGPRGFPIIGSMLSLTENLYLDFLQLAKEYGDIFTIKIGSHHVVIVNNYELIKETLVKKSTDFAGRPQTFTGNMGSEGFKDIILSDYSPSWKLHRKIAHQAIRNYASGDKLENMMRKDAIPLLTQILEDNEGKVIAPRPLLFLTVNNIVAQFCFGQKYTLDDPELKAFMDIIDDFAKIAGNGLVADVIPWTAIFPTSAAREMDKVNNKYLGMIYKKFYEHKQKFDQDNLNDLIDYLLDAQRQAKEENADNISSLTDTHLVQTVSDMFGAGIDTTTHTMDWSIIFLTRYPDVQAKVAREIHDVIGRDRLPLISDRPNLPYCDAVIHELMRIRTVVPMSVPHKALVDSSIGGYVIPKDTWVMVNLWAAQMDEKHWDNPQVFRPERFIDKDGSLKAKQDNFIPFSAGRRVCLGESLAKPEIFLMFTSLYQSFAFSPVPGKELPSLDGNAATLVLRAPEYEVVVKKRI
ncbi:steroid 17-alpha-hydroxylase/17,20 lyase-like [Saccoglossus kowalevskii]|uniref:Steroid 17-alpha-hydroxylase/17,20 lyase-like n=1 Tax=Saccoglossus kowalevskii TaxID=10224 RepID=A0ABM0GIW0_SACKO|nr:PREDICTED: steroid 17-alpha-hydroxylase/17,20 lyase-like [Saccoglossus kowalevskii]